VSSARAQPYPPPGYAIRIPQPIWRAALETMRGYGRLGHEDGRRGSEGLVYLAGVVANQEMVVTGLYRLDHEAEGDRVIVTPEQSRWLLRTLRERDEKLFGQLHSHRGIAGHSYGDDLHATSFHEGFISIVAPDFGDGVEDPGECAVLEYRNGGFEDLDGHELDARLRVVAPVATRASVPAAATRRSAWRRFAQRTRSIARGRR
jgi:hypothetical protein